MPRSNPANSEYHSRTQLKVLALELTNWDDIRQNERVIRLRFENAQTTCAGVGYINGPIRRPGDPIVAVHILDGVFTACVRIAVSDRGVFLPGEHIKFSDLEE